MTGGLSATASRGRHRRPRTRSLERRWRRLAARFALVAAVSAVVITLAGTGQPSSDPVALARSVPIIGDSPTIGRGATRPLPAPGSCDTRVSASALATALAGAEPGDTLCVSGDSDQRLEITRSGAERAPITVAGDGRSTVKGITIEADHVVVEGFNVRGGAPGISMTGDHITVRNNTVTSPRGGDHDGLRFFGTNLTIERNTISDVENIGGAHADCMQTFASDTPPSRNVLIENNRCERIDNQCLIAEGPDDGEGDGEGQSSDITFTRNYCQANASQAVMIEDVQDVVITHNKIVGDLDKAFALDIGSTGALIRHNHVAADVDYIVGIDDSSRKGYQGPEPGGPPWCPLLVC